MSDTLSASATNHLQRAQALHAAGRGAEAQQAYRAALQAQPNLSAALHGLGVLAYQQGSITEALQLLAQAAAQAPGRADVNFDFGLTQYRAGNMPAAASLFQHAVALQPNWPEAHYNLGNALREAGDIQAAMRAFRQALKFRPAYLQAEVNLANLLKDEGKLEQALSAYRRVLARQPNLPDTQNNLGTALLAAGDRAGAETAFRTALRQRPDFPAALANLAAIRLHTAGATAEARALFARARALLLPAMHAAEPGLEARCILAECHLGLRDYEAAATLLRATIALYPHAWRPHVDLVETLRSWGRLAEAEAALPEQVPQAGALRDLLNRSVLWFDLRHFDRAEAACRAAMKLAPQQPQARYNLSNALLAAGRMEEGFTAFEARIAIARPAAPPGRAWEGGAVRGRHILVMAEEGLGDSIQFARWLPRLAAQGAKVTAIVPPTLVRLLSRLEGAPHMLPAGAAPPRADGWAMMLSLPRLLGMGDTARLNDAYLTADETDVDAWRAWLPQTGMRVGLAWAGNPNYPADHLRSCPPASLAPLAQLSGVHWINLQPGAPADAIPGLALQLPGGRLQDMADTAALIMALDLVITVDTAVAHLVGALGRPVWLLNRFNACWRWQAGTDRSIWYRSLRQFRQSVPGDWGGPVDAVVSSLEERKGDVFF